MRSIRMFREKAGLTQRQLQAASGVSQTQISWYETGVHNPEPATLQKLADGLGIEPWQFRYAEEEIKRRRSVGQMVEEYIARAS